MAKYLIAHDLGTSGNKATLFNIDGSLVDSSVYSYDLYVDKVNYAEQDADDWWRAVCESTKKLVANINPDDVLAVSFSGQMMGCLCVDKDGNPLRRSLIWADMRSTEEENEIRQKIDEKEYYRLTGNKISASYSAAKLMWIKKHEPEIYEETYKVLNAKDYIIYKLTGEFTAEPSDASGTGFFDINNNCWSKELMDIYGLDIDKLPTLMPSTAVAGLVTEKAAELTGLSVGTKVVCGGGDGVCAAVGSGATKEGVANCCLGTSSWVSFASKTPVFSPDMITFNFAHAVPGYYVPCGTMQCGGGSLSWIVKQLFKDSQKPKPQIYDDVNEMAKESGIGANGLLFLPYLMGERSPRWNPNAKGTFIGFTIEHNRGDMLRAVMEGVAFNLNIILKEFQQNGGNIAELNILGGGARNIEWCKIFADVFEVPIIIPNHLEEATSMGAAVIAGVGCGVYENFDALSLFIKNDTEFKPNKENSEKYAKYKELFDQSYYALKDIFDKI